VRRVRPRVQRIVPEEPAVDWEAAYWRWRQSGIRRSLVAEEREYARTLLARRDSGDRAAFAGIAERYANSGQDHVSALAYLIVYRGLGWRPLEEWPPESSVTDLDDLEVCVHLLGHEGRGDEIGRGLEGIEASGEVKDLVQTSRFVIVHRPAAAPRTVPEALEPHRRVPGDVSRNEVVESSSARGVAHRERPAAAAAKTSPEPAQAYAERVSSFDPMADVVSILWARGFGVSIDAVPWRASRWISVNVWGPGRVLVAKFDRPSLVEGLNELADWLESGPPTA
jgi:hypothetical protein